MGVANATVVIKSGIGHGKRFRSQIMFSPRKFLGLAAALSLLVAGPAANAVTLTVGGANYLGSITPNTPSSGADEEGYINAIAALAAGDSGTCIDGTYTCSRIGTTLGEPPFPAADFEGKDETLANGPFVDLAGSFLYIVGKYGNAGVGGQFSYVWYFADGVTGRVELPSSGLSHISWFNSSSSSSGGGSSSGGASSGTDVPAPASTLILLGFGLMGIGFMRRRAHSA